MTRIAKLGAAALLLSVLAGVGIHFWKPDYSTAIGQPGGAESPAPKGTAGSAVPVTAAQVKQHDVPVIIEGLGTVQPLNTATTRTQVQGTLESVDFVEGQDVKRGQVLARIDPRVYRAQVDQAEAALERDKATLANFQADLNRSQPLLSRGFATAQTVDTQKSQVAQGTNTVKLDEAALEGAKTQLSFATITAPFDGVTGIRKIDPGNIVHPADTNGLVVVTQIQPIAAIFTLPSADISRVQEAISAGDVAVDAYDAANKIKLDHGSLMLIDNQVDSSTGTVRLKASFPNAKRALWPGAFVNIHLTVAVQHNALTVPLPAVQQGPNGQLVYAIKPDGTVGVRNVVIGQSRSGWVTIQGGVTANDTVVVAGQYRLWDGAAIEVVPPDQENRVQSASTASAGMLP
jgi:multidrug efflux system membrane fusion protein